MTTSPPVGAADGADGLPEIPVNQRIELLSGLLATPSGDVDVPELTGLLGCALLELHERESGGDTLVAALARLHEAVAAAPDHPDRGIWCAALGGAYRLRAVAQESVADYSAAIRWYTTLYEETPAGRSDRDLTGIELLELYWARYRLRRETEDGAAVRPSDVDSLIEATGRVEVSGRDPENAWYAMMLRAFAHLERYDATGHPPDLDQGIALLAASVWELPPDAPQLNLGRAELASAYRQRAERDGDLDSLELSIATGERAGVEVDPSDEDAWQLLHSSQAIAYGSRWRLTGDRRDLNRAIVGWQLAMAVPPDLPPNPWAAGQCGELLRERAELTAVRADVEAAISLLKQAALALSGDTDGWRWFELGRAYHTRWRLTRNRASLDEAARCLTRSLLTSGPDADFLLLTHQQRLLIIFDALGCDTEWYDAERPDRRVSGTVASFRTALAEGRTALAATVGADDQLRAVLALMLGYGEICVTAHPAGGAERLDERRVGDLLATAGRLGGLPGGFQELLDLCEGLLTDHQLRDAVAGAAGAVVSGPAEDPVEGLRSVLSRDFRRRNPHRVDPREPSVAGNVPYGRSGSPAGDGLTGDGLTLVTADVEMLATMLATFNSGRLRDRNAGYWHR